MKTGDDQPFPASAGQPGHGTGPFVQAVVGQLSRAMDSAGAGAQQRLDWLTDRLASILVACEQGDEEATVAALIEDPELLSAVFQNVDLLYANDYPHADALSVLTLDAVHRAVEAEEG